jgi:uncharacterized protein YjbI with pentapeptide repeats
VVRVEPVREPYPPDLDADPEPLAVPDDPVAELARGTIAGDLAGRSFRRLDLLDVRAAGGDWANLGAPRAVLNRVELRDVRLTGAQLAEATVRDTTFAGCRLDLVGLRMARLERVAFVDCRLEELDLYGARLEDVRFEDCLLREATLDGATLTRCSFRRCDLAGLRGAERLAGAQLTWDDVLANAPVFAAALGVVVVE